MEFFIIFLFGLVLGSFLNVLIDRLPVGESVLWGRSHCDKCKRILRWFELIPLLSYLIQQRRCRRCHIKLSLQYPAIELLTAIILVFLSMQSVTLPVFMSYCLIVFSLFVIFFADLKYQIIPDSMVVVGLIGAVLNLASQGLSLQSWMPFVASGVGVSVFFFILWIITKGRGMGFGDVKLAFLLGLLLGFPNIIVALYIAFLTGAVVGVILILVKGKHLKTKIAFGPFLILGTLVAVVWGGRIMSWWRNFL